MKAKTISATEFKAKCLAVLDQIAEHGGTVTITKRGLPVAVLSPAPRNGWKSLEGAWAGKVPPDLADTEITSLWEIVSE